MARDWLILDEFVVQCVIGIFEAEKDTAQKLQLEIGLGLDLQPAAAGDLSRSVNYATVVEQLVFLAKEGRWGLLESLGMAALQLLLAPPAAQEARAQVAEARLRICKPEIFGGRVRPGIEMTRERSPAALPIIMDGAARLEVLQETPTTGAYRIHVLPGADWISPEGMVLMVIAGNPQTQDGSHAPGHVLARGCHRIHNSQTAPITLLGVSQPPMTRARAGQMGLGRTKPGRSPVAIVTGAGTGIGRAVAESLFAAGWRVTLVGRRAEPLNQTAQLAAPYRSLGADALTLVADVGVQGDATRIVADTLSHWGGIDVLVNNAGVAAVVPIDWTDWTLLETTFAINVFGPALLIKQAWPTFRQQGAGCIINISSMATVDPFPNFFAYAASKAALESLARSAVNERGEMHLRAFNIAPGTVETALLRSFLSEAVLPPERVLPPAAVASVVLQCISGERDASIGKTIILPSP